MNVQFAAAPSVSQWRLTRRRRPRLGRKTKREEMSTEDHLASGLSLEPRWLPNRLLQRNSGTRRRKQRASQERLGLYQLLCVLSPVVAYAAVPAVFYNHNG